MTEFEKMRSQELYNFRDPELTKSFVRAKKLCAKLNQMSSKDDGYRELIEELIPGIPKSASIAPPFNCDHGHGIIIGEHSFMNYGCVILDSALVTIGDHVKIGPQCKLFTPQHPINFLERRETVETAYPITIGNDTWIGGGATICPGVSIGERCIVAAGAVVVHNVPDDCMVAGNPAVIKKRL